MIPVGVDPLRRRLAALVAGLAALHAATVPIILHASVPAVRRVASFGNLDEEQSLGTLVAVLLLTACAGTSAVSARHRPVPGARPWGLLTVLFGFLAVDEHLSLHEGLERALDDAFPSSPLEFAWVLPYVVLAVAVAVAAVPLLRAVDRPVARALVLGGGVYVLGAAGVEVLGGAAARAAGFDSVAYLAAAGVEEVLELAGAVIALTGLLAHLADRPFVVEVRRP